jgi:putative hemolysin
MKDKLISKELLHSISPILAKPIIRQCVMKLGGFDKVNRVYDSAKHKSGTDIEDAMIDGLGITRKVHNIDVLKQFDGKPFITVSNHPYGHIDGIMLIGEVAKVRPDFKVMVNWMLGQIDIMGNHFIGVNPYSSNISARSSLNGVKECITHLRENHPLGFFPAGAISKTVGFNKIRDKEWQESVLKLIHKANVPIVPAYFSGQNSRFFNFLDRIDWRVRNVRLCHELDTKKGKTIHLVFGEPILPEKQKEFSDIKKFGDFLQNETYALSAQVS